MSEVEALKESLISMSADKRSYLGKQRKALRGFIHYDIAMLEEMCETLVEQNNDDLAIGMQATVTRLRIKMLELLNNTNSEV